MPVRIECLINGCLSTRNGADECDHRSRGGLQCRGILARVPLEEPALDYDAKRLHLAVSSAILDNWSARVDARGDEFGRFVELVIVGRSDDEIAASMNMPMETIDEMYLNLYVLTREVAEAVFPGTRLPIMSRATLRKNFYTAWLPLIGDLDD